ncbi:methyltransferase family protein [Enterococcus sp. LJL128]
MNAFILMLPLLIIRFAILGVLNPKAAYFAPLSGNERIAYYIYQVANLVLLIFPLFLKLTFKFPNSLLGLVVYLLGILLLLITTINFARPKNSGLRTHGLYYYSRNPMYVGYFFFYLGCATLTESLVLLISLVYFQISAHWIILSEERWCKKEFGEAYLNYCQQVRRYL